MAGKINSNAVINELQRSMALKESGAEGPTILKKDTLVVQDTVVARLWLSRIL